MQFADCNHYVSNTCMQFSMELESIILNSWTFEKSVNIPAPPNALRRINDTLWCCHNDGISVFDENLQRIHDIPQGNFGMVFDIAQLPRHAETINDNYHMDAFVAADHGLFFHSAQG